MMSQREGEVECRGRLGVGWRGRMVEWRGRGREREREGRGRVKEKMFIHYCLFTNV